MLCSERGVPVEGARHGIDAVRQSEVGSEGAGELGDWVLLVV